jgi:two-component system, LytTR family, response regulator
MKNPIIRILIIDDEKAIISICKNYLLERENIVIIGECESVNEAEILINATQPDLILLDINLIGGTGFDLLKRFSNPHFKVIFITVSSDYALNAIKSGAIDYILKPIEEQELLSAVDKVLMFAENTSSVQLQMIGDYIKGKPDRFVVRTFEAIHIVHFNELIYCQSDKGYTTFFLINGSEILVSKPLKDYESFLPTTIFARVHQSYLVNINFVDKIRKDLMLILKNKKEIPISIRKKEEIFHVLNVV